MPWYSRNRVKYRRSPTGLNTPLLIAVLIVAAAGGAETSEPVSFWEDLPDDVVRERLLDAMTPEELVGQTLMIGWVGQDPSSEALEWIRTTNLGGVKIFGWNGADLIRLAHALGTMQELAAAHRLDIPLLTATDQEGGWVRHVKGSGDLSTIITPGNMAIGASNLPYDAYRSAYYIGMELRALGINMNFAPTVDVYINPEAHVIGPRAFSNDPVQSGLLGTAFFHGLDETRVIATAKHFPGHGNASEDSHGVLPVIYDSMDELTSRDLVPFRFLIKEGVPAILSGHLRFPSIWDDGRPASLSAYFKRQLLRRDLGFEGLIITDDLYMGGAWEYGADRNWGIEEIVVEALRAGNDLVMLSQTPTPRGSLYEHLMSTYEADPSFREIVREAAGRVIDLKLEYLKPANRVPLVPDVERIADAMREQGSLDFLRDQAARSVTVVRDALLPFDTSRHGRVLLAGKDQDFLRIGADFLPHANRHRLSPGRFFSADEAEIRRFRNLVLEYDTVVFCLSDPHSLQILAAIEDLEAEVVVLSILTPIYLAELPWVGTALALYGWGEESFRAGFSALFGRITPSGRLPVSIDRGHH